MEIANKTGLPTTAVNGAQGETLPASSEQTGPEDKESTLRELALVYLLAPSL